MESKIDYARAQAELAVGIAQRGGDSGCVREDDSVAQLFVAKWQLGCLIVEFVTEVMHCSLG